LRKGLIVVTVFVTFIACICFCYSIRRMHFFCLIFNVISFRLLEIPENLPRSLKVLRLSFNRISLVHSPANYDFCVNCTDIYLDKNPTICNENLAKMLFWLAKNRKENPIWFGVRYPCETLSG